MSCSPKNPWETFASSRNGAMVLRYSANHPLPFYYGKDVAGGYMFFCEGILIPSDMAFPSLKGISVHVADCPQDSALKNLVLCLLDKKDWELFLAICNDLAFATCHEDKYTASSKILSRLIRWVRFLQLNKRAHLEPSVIRGLIGELYFMLRHLTPTYGITKALGSWLGPKGAPHDFCVGETSVEVKTTKEESHHEVTISSAEQLTISSGELFLYILILAPTVETDSTAISLGDLIDEATALLANDFNALNCFYDLLAEIGYYPDSEQETAKFIAVDEKSYKIRDGFPRITKDILPSGIKHLQYTISLDMCGSFAGSPEWY